MSRMRDATNEKSRDRIMIAKVRFLHSKLERYDLSRSTMCICMLRLTA